MNRHLFPTFLLALAASLIQPLLADITLKEMGSFAAGGSVVQRPGAFDSQRFEGWGKAAEEGQTYHADHAAVDYYIPAGARAYPLVYIHGYGQSARCWQSTPDGREGFSSILLRHGYSAYLVDLPGRGRAGRTSAAAGIKPLADEQFWFNIFRIGNWPHFNPGVQFPQDEESLHQFFRQMTPDISEHDGKKDVAAIHAVLQRSGKSILVTHSAGGLTGWLAAMNDENVRAIISLEPGGFVFPEGEVPAPMPSRTGTLKGVPVPMEDFRQLTRLPIVLYFGDYIPEGTSDRLGDENWRVRLQMARQFVATLQKHGGNATLVELPKLGIHGNTHFLMSDLNNADIAHLILQWLKEQQLHH